MRTWLHYDQLDEPIKTTLCGVRTPDTRSKSFHDDSKVGS